MLVRDDGSPCERCGAVLAVHSGAQAMARHRASRTCSTGPLRRSLTAAGFVRSAGSLMTGWCLKLAVPVRNEDTTAPFAEGLEAWVPQWAALLYDLQRAVPALVIHAAVGLARRVPEVAATIIATERTAGPSGLRDWLLADTRVLLNAVSLGDELLRERGWPDA